MFKLLDTLIGYLKGKPYWAKIEPALTLFSLYLMTLVLAYQYIEWQYHFSPALGLYLRSYIVKQISLVYVGVAFLALVFGATPAADEARFSGLRRLTRFATAAGRRLALAGVVVVVLASLFVYFSPHRVSQIRIRFLGEPKFNEYAFAYIIYELNRQEKTWHFEINFDSADPTALSHQERAGCGDVNLDFCFAKMLAASDPEKGFIGITPDALGEDSFWVNDGTVSVISTDRWENYAPPSVYEYLTYSVLVQSILMHLNGQCSGLPKDAFATSRTAYGDLFEFAPRRQEMKAAILAAHLSPQGQQLLANCFGLDYMNTCERLLSLNWLRSNQVQGNLERSFGVKL